MRRIGIPLLAAIWFATSVGGCGGYYRVKDPSTGNVYYTEDLEQGKTGAVIFKDANSGSTVTLQSSEVTEVNREEFKANTKKQ